MSKMGSHEPFGHLQHKLWQKERSGVKLTIWLPTTKSRESTRPWCVQEECDTPLESSRWELQLCFRLCPNQRSEQRIIVPQSCGSPNRGNLGLLLGSPGTKNHSAVGATGRHREYYMGEGGGFPRVWAVASLVSPELPVAYLNIKGAPKCELTNLLVGLVQVRISN
jgi:hypothetical protein